MEHKIKNFEIQVLRPLHLIVILMTTFFLINKLWTLSIAGVIGFFYIGIIGASLHPLQSASDLAKGPLTNQLAKKEFRSISPQEVNLLVGNACTKVGILLGFGSGIIVFDACQVSWFLTIIIALIVTTIAGFFLKVIFKTQP